MFRILIFFLLIPFSVVGQSYDFNKQWEFLGPDNKPSSPKNVSAAGVGPIEFIRVFQKDSKNLLAGSNSGGLFFSEDGGENWINSGSDAWPYSGCGWADFYPTDARFWFAYSNVSDNNGKPGKMGVNGGIYRTLNEGTDWQLIGSPLDFGGAGQRSIYGLRFEPNNPQVLFVLTDDGLYYTKDCLQEIVSWIRVPDLSGWIYDMDFVAESVFVSNFFEGKWNVHVFDLNKYLTHKTIVPVQDLTSPMRTITFEPFRKNLIVLVDYKDGSDFLYEYNVVTSEMKILLGNQQVNFGSGHTFAASPHDSTEFIIGYTTQFKKWNYTNLREKKIGSGYHVDIEFIAYDPIDTSKIYMACHGGVYISNDRGLTWQNKSNGLGVAEVMGLDVSETDPNQIVIGCFHDGSSVRADFNKDGNYSWRSVNGGDALTPLIDPTNAGIVYTSTQFNGGGLYYSSDTANKLSNIHNDNGLGTSGWELTALLHPVDPKKVYFNFEYKEGDGKGNIDLARTSDASKNKSAEIISDFRLTHNLKSYKVYGIYNNEYFPDQLFAYVLHYDKDSADKPITKHRLFRTEIARDSAAQVIDSWYELDVPRSSWIGDVEGDPANPNQIYLSYVNSKENAINPELSSGLIYSLKYFKKNHGLKREVDISRNLPNVIAGRFNMVCLNNDEKEIFIATRNGIYYGNKKTLKGLANWQLVGYGLPHCKVFGLHYHHKEKLLTVGLFGRGVWRYHLQ